LKAIRQTRTAAKKEQDYSIQIMKRTATNRASFLAGLTLTLESTNNQ
jgi:hypothetical protein